MGPYVCVTAHEKEPEEDGAGYVCVRETGRRFRGRMTVRQYEKE